jgi:hypothetical protein
MLQQETSESVDVGRSRARTDRVKWSVYMVEYEVGQLFSSGIGQSRYTKTLAPRQLPNWEEGSHEAIR